MTKVYLNADGSCANIGEWDLRPMLNEAGDVVITNPIPEGVTEAEADTVTGWDDGVYVATDPRRNKT